MEFYVSRSSNVFIGKEKIAQYIQKMYMHYLYLIVIHARFFERVCSNNYKEMFINKERYAGTRRSAKLYA